MPPLTSLLRHLRRSGLVLLTLLLASRAWGEETLHERYRQIKLGLITTLPGTSISLASDEQEEVLSAEVSSILHHPFDEVAAALAETANWCRLMPLHFNIKACTYEREGQGELINVYSGRKHYQTPDESYRMAYRFEKLQRDDGKLRLLLSAERGPVGTRDYRIELSAMAVEEGTLLQIHSSYRPSMLSSLFTGSYLATLGRDKVGFSRVGKDDEAELVQGIRGVIERNVMRYHLAIDAFLAVPATHYEGRHEAMLEYWFALNERYPKQLHEMTQEEYLKIKRREWENQQQLQQALNEELKLAAMQYSK